MRRASRLIASECAADPARRVDRVGFEPTASALRRRRSSADLSARAVVHIGARHIAFVPAATDCNGFVRMPTCAGQGLNSAVPVSAFAATMVLRLYNTRSMRKEPFSSRTPGVVKMYVCGPTTYDHSHLGHARSYIDFDTARRYLEFLGNRVVYVQNFTDIEEVIIRRAKEVGQEPLAYAQHYIDCFLEDMRALNVRPADHMPKVSEHIPEITALVRRLVDRGYAYSVDGEVDVRTKKAKHSFGILSHQKFEDIVVASTPAEIRKEDPLDFALWKTSKGDEPSWP